MLVRKKLDSGFGRLFCAVVLVIFTLSLCQFGCHAAQEASEAWERELLEGAEVGNITRVRTALNNGADVNAVNEDGDSDRIFMGDTALLLAARNNHPQVVDLLLRSGAEVNAANEYNEETALIEAASAGHVNMVDRLLQAEADPTIAGGWEPRTPLMHAAQAGHAAVVDLLMLRWFVEPPTVNEMNQAELSAAARQRIQSRVAQQAQQFTAHIRQVARELVEHGMAPDAIILTLKEMYGEPRISANINAINSALSIE